MSEETTFFRGSPSVLTRVGPLCLGFLVLAAGVALFFMASSASPVKWLFLALAALALFFIAGTVLNVKSTQYEITTERIRVRRGLMTKRTDELELYRAVDTSLIEPLPLRTMGLGTIEVRTNDASTPTLYLQAIHGARNVRENLRKCIEECRDRKGVRVTELEQRNPGA